MGRPRKTENLPAVKDGAMVPGDFLKEDKPTGSDDIGANDVKTPRIVLAQPSSRSKPDDVNEGDFYNNLNRDNYGPKMSIIIFKAWSSRAMFNTDFTLACKSEDCVKGTQHGECSACGFAKWGKGKDGKKSPPCSQGYTYVVLTAKDVKDGMFTGLIKIPSLLTLAKSQVPAAKLINSNLQVEKSYKRSSYCQVYQLETAEKVFKVGKAYVVKAQPATYINAEQFEYLKRIAALVEQTDYKSRMMAEEPSSDEHTDPDDDRVKTATEVMNPGPAPEKKDDKKDDLPF